MIKIGNLRFYFYSNDHLPIHVHVEGPDARAKFEVDPVVKLTQSRGFSKATLKKIELFIEENRELIIDRWEEFFDE